MKKLAYIIPETTIVKLRVQQQLMAGSIQNTEEIIQDTTPDESDEPSVSRRFRSWDDEDW